MLYRPEERMFLAADQVIARISPNVSVHPMEPDLDALGIYLASLRAIRASVNEDVLVLPGHGLPFYGLHRRIDALIEHHAERCGRSRRPAANGHCRWPRYCPSSSRGNWTRTRPASRSARCWRTSTTCWSRGRCGSSRTTPGCIATGRPDGATPAVRNARACPVHRCASRLGRDAVPRQADPTGACCRLPSRPAEPVAAGRVNGRANALLPFCHRFFTCRDRRLTIRPCHTSSGVRPKMRRHLLAAACLLPLMSGTCMTAAPAMPRRGSRPTATLRARIT